MPGNSRIKIMVSRKLVCDEFRIAGMRRLKFRIKQKIISWFKGEYGKLKYKFSSLREIFIKFLENEFLKNFIGKVHVSSIFTRQKISRLRVLL